MASIFFAAPMRCASEPLRGIVGLLLLRSALFFGNDFLANRFFAASFLAKVAFPALEVLRVLPAEWAFFIVRAILHVPGANVNADR